MQCLMNIAVRHVPKKPKAVAIPGTGHQSNGETSLSPLWQLHLHELNQPRHPVDVGLGAVFKTKTQRQPQGWFVGRTWFLDEAWMTSVKAHWGSLGKLRPNYGAAFGTQRWELVTMVSWTMKIQDFIISNNLVEICPACSRDWYDILSL